MHNLLGQVLRGGLRHLGKEVVWLVFLSHYIQFMEPSGKIDGKKALGLHTGGFRESQQPFITVP